ncbi:phosphotransferase family protein [Sulfitobacter sp. SK012]|uniref:phosphotransferase family protein n=1 Tax=Sulfitobacter sp. SK012 TaxID=1389005 RepID=UPI000E0A0DCA|nr:phosphotransferase family protein [Sulfitobacter sp. SK012]AXI45673.1 phosphotransferase family protein [Sulfitobacter sp. SK012]
MHTYDTALLAKYLAKHVDGFGMLDGIEKFSDGQSNPTYKLTSGKHQYVLRAKPPGKLLKSAHAVDREYRVMQALGGTDVPVPKVLHLSGDDSPMGTQFMVMEMVQGRIFWDPALPELEARARAEVYDQMNATLAALHCVDPAAVSLADYGKPGNYFERQITRWSAQYRDAQTDPLPDADWLIDWLNGNMVPDDGASSIVHGDFRIDNMIFAPNNETLIALLDWELSTLGHPLADLAYQCMHWRLPHAGHFRGLAGVDRANAGLPSEDAYVDLYCQRRRVSRPENWNFYVVFSYFRLLAILQGVLKRGLDGNASNPKNAAMMRDVIVLLAKDARALANT